MEWMGSLTHTIDLAASYFVALVHGLIFLHRFFLLHFGCCWNIYTQAHTCVLMWSFFTYQNENVSSSRNPYFQMEKKSVLYLFLFFSVFLFVLYLFDAKWNWYFVLLAAAVAFCGNDYTCALCLRFAYVNKWGFTLQYNQSIVFVEEVHFVLGMGWNGQEKGPAHSPETILREHVENECCWKAIKDNFIYFVSRTRPHSEPFSRTSLDYLIIVLKLEKS